MPSAATTRSLFRPASRGVAARHRWQDLIIYEAHLKGFTANPTDPDVLDPGTFRGMGQAADYLLAARVEAGSGERRRGENRPGPLGHLDR